MKTSKYVILGGGMVAGYAVKELVDRGLKPGELTIVSADSYVPYERPPLSKGFLAGKDSEESIRINPQQYYREHGIEVKLGCEVKGLDVERRCLLRPGDDLGFGKLIVATGARARTLDIPGSDLSGISYLRSLDDSKDLRAHADCATRALVIGGGFIGMEVASVLAQKKIATTIALREDRIWKQFFTPAMSQFFERYFASRGVQFIKQAKAEQVLGKGAVTAVSFGGDRTIACDLLVVGIGASPVTEVVKNSGIEVADGVVVNEFLESSVPGIYAAGDVASYQDTLFGKRRRVEHWDNAVSQGQHCARALLGERTPFIHVPYFFSDVFDLSYEFWGDVSNADETVERGDLSSSSFSVWWLKQKQLVAAFTMNRPDEEREAAPRWIAARKLLSGDRLKKSVSLSEAE